MGSMERATELLKGKKTAFVVGHGVLQQKHGTLIMDALINLALMTGSLGGEKKGFYFLSRENNEVGAWDMGTVPDFLPGRQSLHNDKNRKHWERLWESKLSSDPGLNLVRMIQEAEKGTLKALYIMGENPLRSFPQPERGGSFTNLEGRIQSFEPVVSPPGEARPDWEILALLFGRMGYPKGYSSLQQIRTEIRNQVPMYAGLKRDRGESWIKETSNMKLFHPNGEGELIHFSPVITTEDERSDEEYPFKAIMGFLRYHLGSGTRTGYSARIKDFALNGEIDISSKDGARLNLKEGDKVRISSPYGSIFREVTLKTDLRPGLIFIPLAFKNNDAMQLIELSQLGETDSPGLKECNVKIERIEGS
jgi:formate dehydrogenase alpha subunit